MGSMFVDDEACSAYRGDEKCIQNYGRKTLKRPVEWPSRRRTDRDSRICTKRRRLWTQHSTFSFLTRRATSWLQRLTISHEGWRTGKARRVCGMYAPGMLAATPAIPTAVSLSPSALIPRQCLLRPRPLPPLSMAINYSPMIIMFEGSISLHITKRSLLQVTRRFGGTCYLYFQGGSVSQSRNEHEATCFIQLPYFAYSSQYFLLASCWFRAWLPLRPRRWRQHISPKRLLTFNGLQDFILQKTELFTTTAMIISNTS
jgi:hypothetical protein